MALFLKNATGAVGPNHAAVDQYSKASVAAASNPQAASRALFNVVGGRVLVKLLLGEVTTVQETATNNMSVTFTPTGGSNADVASALDCTGDAAGTYYFVEGDGTALVAGSTVKFGAIPAAVAQGFVIDAGTIYWKSAHSTTGAVKWDIYYTPIDPGAHVVAA